MDMSAASWGEPWNTDGTRWEYSIKLNGKQPNMHWEEEFLGLPPVGNLGPSSCFTRRALRTITIHRLVIDLNGSESPGRVKRSLLFMVTCGWKLSSHRSVLYSDRLFDVTWKWESSTFKFLSSTRRRTVREGRYGVRGKRTSNSYSSLNIWAHGHTKL